MKKLLLLHGAIGSADQIKPLSDLLKNNFEVYGLNFSGHGGEALLDGQFSMKLFANDVIRWMDKQSISAIDIFGYSMGGYVALYIAKHFPGRVGKIITMATKFEWNEAVAEKESKMMIPEKIEEKIPAFADALKQRHAPADWKQILNKTAAMMKEMGKNNPLSEKDFAEIENEVLLTVGDRDKMVTLEETISVYRKLKNGAFTVFPFTPHPIEQINVSLIRDAIVKFIK